MHEPANQPRNASCILSFEALTGLLDITSLQEHVKEQTLNLEPLSIKF